MKKKKRFSLESCAGLQGRPDPTNGAFRLHARAPGQDRSTHDGLPGEKHSWEGSLVGREPRLVTVGETTVLESTAVWL